MKNLIPMTDFVLEEHKKTNWNSYNVIVNYANFLKRLLELWMFVPCDEDGNFIEETLHIELYEGNTYDLDCLKYREAKERCLFEGYEYFGKWSDGHLIVKDKNTGFGQINMSDFFYIEDLLNYNLKPSKTALKQIGL